MAIPKPAALHHTCFVVRNLESTARALSDSLGIGPWNVWTINPAESRVHGIMKSFSFRVALAAVGGGTYELVSPHKGASVYDEHLERHGEGFHHTCLVYPTLEAVRAVKAELVRQGRDLIQEASAGGEAAAARNGHLTGPPVPRESPPPEIGRLAAQPRAAPADPIQRLQPPPRVVVTRRGGLLLRAGAS